MATKIATAPRSLGRSLAFTEGASTAVCTRILDPHGISLAQWVVLQSLWRNGEMSVKDIAGLTGNAPPATSRIVDRMIAGGLLHRQQDTKDRRAVTIGLTEKGEALRHLQPVYKQLNSILMAGLSRPEEDQLFSLLARVEGNARKWLEDNDT